MSNIHDYSSNAPFPPPVDEPHQFSVWHNDKILYHTTCEHREFDLPQIGLLVSSEIGFTDRLRSDLVRRFWDESPQFQRPWQHTKTTELRTWLNATAVEHLIEHLATHDVPDDWLQHIEHRPLRLAFLGTVYKRPYMYEDDSGSDSYVRCLTLSRAELPSNLLKKPERTLFRATRALVNLQFERHEHPVPGRDAVLYWRE